jgi:hypothetical protein
MGHERKHVPLNTEHWRCSAELRRSKFGMGIVCTEPIDRGRLVLLEPPLVTVQPSEEVPDILQGLEEWILTHKLLGHGRRRAWAESCFVTTERDASIERCVCLARRHFPARDVACRRGAYVRAGMISSSGYPNSIIARLVMLCQCFEPWRTTPSV